MARHRYRQFPVAATYSKNIVTHENGIDDNEIGDRVGITAFITSEFETMETGLLL